MKARLFCTICNAPLANAGGIVFDPYFGRNDDTSKWQTFVTPDEPDTACPFAQRVMDEEDDNEAAVARVDEHATDGWALQLAADDDSWTVTVPFNDDVLAVKQ